MMMLMASETVTEAAAVSDHVAMGMAFIVVLTVVALSFLFGFRVIDKITPGDLSKELLGESNGGKHPNVALAIVVAALILGMALVLGATIIGVLLH